MTELVVEEGQEKAIARGNHRLRLLDIHRNGTLVFDGPTVIFCDRMTTEQGARIVYRSSAALTTDNHFDIWSLDASGVNYLEIIGDGKNGLDYKGKARAADGAPGRGATNPKWDDADGRAGAPGGGGANGAPGGNGEPAVDFMLNFPLLPPGAEVRISAVGGNGGSGQNGGEGGRGGSGAKLHGAKDGGPGGAGGRGGDSGDAGIVALFIVVPDEVYGDRARRNETLNTIRVTVNTAAGNVGDGGSGGIGGPRGDHKGPNIGRGNPGQGASGRDGEMGQPGNGPTEDRKSAWVKVDLMAQSAYQAYYAQQIAAENR